MILAGDIGGTKTNLALFNGDPSRPEAFSSYPSREHEGLESMVRTFLDTHPVRVDRACFGVAGPVRGGSCVETTNLAWPVFGPSVAAALGLERIGLLNDLEANAWGIAALQPEDFHVLNEGEPQIGGNAAVISAGTGLGQAGLFWDGERHRPFATEGGHADFAPTSEREVRLYRFLAAELDHVSYERVCSGIGLVNLVRFELAERGLDEPPWLVEAADKGAAIGAAAANGDEAADAALDLLCSIYGAQAGNLALTVMATGGVFLGGGIAPKLLGRIDAGGFMTAFSAKGRFRELLERVPVKVVLNDRTALLGAALFAAR